MEREEVSRSAACRHSYDNGISGNCDAALLAVLYEAGPRRSEAVALVATVYDLETGARRVRSGRK